MYGAKAPSSQDHPRPVHPQMCSHPHPPTLGAFVELEPVLLDDAQHALVGVPGVVGNKEVPVAGQQLDEGGAGARAQSAPGLGLVQGWLQVPQVPGDRSCSFTCESFVLREIIQCLWACISSPMRWDDNRTP